MQQKSTSRISGGAFFITFRNILLTYPPIFYNVITKYTSREVTVLKKFLVFFILITLVLFFAGCSSEPVEPEIPESEPLLEETSEPEEPVEAPIVPEETFAEIPEEPSEPERTPEEIAEICGYTTFEEITAAGYCPDWMQPFTCIIYDENGVPTITEGGELTPEDLVGRPEFETMPFNQFMDEMKIEPKTKVTYGLYGFIQNIYHLWPDGSYNLDYPLKEG